MMIEIEMELPNSMWEKIESGGMLQAPPEVLYGYVAFQGFPEYAQEYWQRAPESERERILRAVVLRTTIAGTDPMVDTYGLAFAMANDYDLRLA